MRIDANKYPELRKGTTIALLNREEVPMSRSVDPLAGEVEYYVYYGDAPVLCPVTNNRCFACANGTVQLIVNNDVKEQLMQNHPEFKYLESNIIDKAEVEGMLYREKEANEKA